MKNRRTFSFILLTFCIISIIATAFIYPYLPDEIPIHFKVQGEADNYGHPMMAFFTASLPLLMLGLFAIVPKLDPKKQSYEKHSKPYGIFIFAMTVFLIIIHWVTILIALGIDLPISLFVPIGIGILFIIIGNYMPQIRQNYTFGIRFPWSLDNPDNWRYTHRIGGYVFILAGILIGLSAFCSPLYQSILFFVAILQIIIVPALASYLYFKKQSHK